jgi:hypothetical protein
VLKTLKTLENEDVVERHAGGGHNGADLFTDDGATPEMVDVGDSTTKDALLESSRWSFVVEDAHGGETPTVGDSRGPSAGSGESDSGEWPGESINPGE